METSRRARETQASPIRKLIPFADRARSEGREVLHLNIGQPDIETPPEALEALRSYREKVLAYSPSDGYRSLKRRIVEYLGTCGFDLGIEEVNVTVGGSEAVLFALAAVTDPGDNVIIPEPFYANYKSFCSMLGVRVVSVTTSFEKGFHLGDPAALEEKIDGRTRAVLLCNPGNPTGTVYTEEEVRAVADIALRRDLFIISDEVYREFRFDRVPFFSPMHIPGAADRVIVTDSVSKRYSSCGARIGFVASRNREVMGAVLKFAMARLSPPSLEQVIAEREFSLDPGYFDPVLAEYQARRDTLFEELSASDLLVPSRPEGAFYMMVRLRGLDSEDFARFLLTDFSLEGETVMVAPAPGFYATEGLGKSEIRLAYVLNTEKTRRAARILREGAEAYRGALREGSGLLYAREH